MAMMYSAAYKQPLNSQHGSHSTNSHNNRKSAFLLGLVGGLTVGILLGQMLVLQRTNDLMLDCLAQQMRHSSQRGSVTPLSSPLTALGPWKDHSLLQRTLTTSHPDSSVLNATFHKDNINNITDTSVETFPDSISDLVVGMSRVKRREFADQFPTGYPLDPDNALAEDVLILYGTKSSIPRQAKQPFTDEPNPLLSVNDAIQHCRSIKVVSIQPTFRAQYKAYVQPECLAIMSNWESHRIHQFSRRYTRLPWRYTPSQPVPPPLTPDQVQVSNQALIDYLTAFPGALERLRPLALAASMGGGSDSSLDNQQHQQPSTAITVLVTNFGQSNLLANFVCTARARQIDLSRVLLFATDPETHHLAQQLGIHSYHDPVIFSSIPSESAINYHDMNYAKIMMAKAYAVHMIAELGHDFLFLDVDIVLYRDPLPFLVSLAQNKTEKNLLHDFDMYFQHDGYHHPDRFKPLSANTGMYYVRNNERSRHFLDTLVRRGGDILAAKSHQQVLTELVNEQTISRGLRVKVLSDYSELFPNGYAFQKGTRVIRDMTKKRANKYPVLFHANWLTTKDKRFAFESTSNWHLQSQCYHEESDAMVLEGLPEDVLGHCCLNEAAETKSLNWFKKEPKKERVTERNVTAQKRELR